MHFKWIFFMVIVFMANLRTEYNKIFNQILKYMLGAKNSVCYWYVDCWSWRMLNISFSIFRHFSSRCALRNSLLKKSKFFNRLMIIFKWNVEFRDFCNYKDKITRIGWVNDIYQLVYRRIEEGLFQDCM